MAEQYDLDKAIRKIPDFPKPGVLFYDVTGVLMTPDAFRYCVDRGVRTAKACDVVAIAAIESRGFVFGSPIAERLGMPLLLIRKKGKLPGETYSMRFSLEYGEDEIEVHKSDLSDISKASMETVSQKARVLLVDDLIATGGTLRAAIDLLSRGNVEVAAIFAVIGLPFLNYGSVLSGCRVETLIDYSGE